MQTGFLQGVDIVLSDDTSLTIENPNQSGQEDRNFNDIECWDIQNNRYVYRAGLTETTENVNSNLVKITLGYSIEKNNIQEYQSLVLGSNTLVYVNKNADNASGTWKTASQLLSSDLLTDQENIMESQPSNISIHSIDTEHQESSDKTLHSFNLSVQNLAMFVNNVCIKFE
jgi:hypothetical protein